MSSVPSLRYRQALMQVEIKWCFRLQWTFSNHHSASWDMLSCGGCEQTPVLLLCDTPGLVVLWEWGQGGTQPFLSSCLAEPQYLPSNPSAPTGYIEVFLHGWGVVFSAWESRCGLTCTHHTMQTGCCRQKGVLNHHTQPRTRRRVSCRGS